ncbi:MAG: 3-deoxy-manno-octulosonate cytidylyltransferase [Candidatus Omnitrophica bacterium CG11_big_fil_rev_8_21_14_0_20_42_13]|uniref:3-deoxy-manno-octulosonate cytidylyltransferase n=1 Tax=Candidatus Ghiorseimicrobium undicola TaxID=1974746 RepID=A0A2H0LXF0_9BACT|nr:MAG: 3-deoxy-manno-octulosonate cytidylyltransferase [Candidatus Omnitrophica bacterium CG11_big_fil_rev_8_21_14_0_20_42_13]
MDVVGVIPARFSSSRFEGKVLADIYGKPMLQWVYEAAKKAKILDDLIIACDNENVEIAARSFGANVVFTSKEHTSGTDRIAEVINPIEAKIIVNIQADEPLIQPSMIEDVASALLKDNSVGMSTLRKEITEIGELYDPNIVKVVVDKDDFALYFSRSPLPSPEREIDKNSPVMPKGFFKHIGLYAYTKDFLFTFKNLPSSSLEKIEKLEQLRVLENGYKIKVLETNFETIGVDTAEDLERLKERIRAQE